MPQLEKNQEIPPSMRYKAVFSDSAQIAIPSSLSRLERRRDSLHATQGGPETQSQLEMKPEFPATSREESRVSHLLFR